MPNRMLERFRAGATGILVLLLAQFALGMIANLYVEFPSPLAGGDAFAWAFGHSLVVTVHVLLAALLLAASLVTAEFAAWSGVPTVARSGVAGLLLVLVAAVCGIWFLTDGQGNASSLLMALAFMGAFVAYAAGLHAARSAAPSH